MSNNYANLNVRGVSQSELSEKLTKMNIRSFVGPEENGWCCFSSEEIEFTRDEKSAICKALSVHFNQPTLFFRDAEDDVLVMELFEKGALVANYNSRPGNYTENPTKDMLKPKVSGIEYFIALNDKVNPAEFEAILLHDATNSTFAYELHELIIALLSLPAYGAVFGFHYASKGEFPIDAERFEKT